VYNLQVRNRDLIHLISNLGVMNHIPTEWMMMKNPGLTLGKIVRDYKTRTAKAIYDAGLLQFRRQLKYYDRIIRNEMEMNNIRDYIGNNVLQWSLDSSCEIPDNL
jgi:hypothetical protein